MMETVDQNNRHSQELAIIGSSGEECGLHSEELTEVGGVNIRVISRRMRRTAELQQMNSDSSIVKQSPHSFSREKNILLHSGGKRFELLDDIPNREIVKVISERTVKEENQRKIRETKKKT
jgi:hypothetical protein